MPAHRDAGCWSTLAERTSPTSAATSPKRLPDVSPGEMASSDGTSSDTLLRLYAALRPFLFGCLRFAAPPKPGETTLLCPPRPSVLWIWRPEGSFAYPKRLSGGTRATGTRARGDFPSRQQGSLGSA